FRYDLHSPQFTQRVDLTPQHRSMALAPVIESAGMGAPPPPPVAMPAPSVQSAPMMDGRSPGAAAPRRAKRSGSREMAADDSASASEEVDMGTLMAQQAPASAQGASMGALFRYDLSDPVTLPDGSSNLVSIVNAKVKGGRVVLFRPEDGGQAYRAV